MYASFPTYPIPLSPKIKKKFYKRFFFADKQATTSQIYNNPV